MVRILAAILGDALYGPRQGGPVSDPRSPYEHPTSGRCRRSRRR
jgi:hypothetical protein